MRNEEIERIKAIASKVSAINDCDIFLYNGPIHRAGANHFLDAVLSQKQRKNLKLLLVTNGGDPDAAYKISRLLQDIYPFISIVVSGLCKSAGTLIAISANEVVFSPHGELGPLDVQTHKEDHVSELQSGLVIGEALTNLEDRAIKKYFDLINMVFETSSNVISFQTASKSAADLIGALYNPIFSQIDPEEIGAKTRSMRITSYYSKRLATRSKNIKDDKALVTLTETYSSHSFVIDKTEAELLFNNVRWVNKEEQELINFLGQLCRWPVRKWDELPLFEKLSPDQNESAGAANEADSADRGKREAGTDSRGPNEPSSAGIEQEDVERPDDLVYSKLSGEKSEQAA